LAIKIFHLCYWANFLSLGTFEIALLYIQLSKNRLGFRPWAQRSKLKAKNSFS